MHSGAVPREGTKDPERIRAALLSHLSEEDILDVQVGIGTGRIKLSAAGKRKISMLAREKKVRIHVKTITLDQKSIEAVSAGQLDLEPIADGLQLPLTNRVAKCVQLEDNGYILSRAMQPGDGLLTISLGLEGPLADLSPTIRQDTLSRILRCATMMFSGRSNNLPSTWRPHHSHSRISFQADRRMRDATGGRTESGRVVVDVVNDKGLHVYAFYLDRTGRKDIASYAPDIAGLMKVAKKVGTALALPEEPLAPEQLGQEFTLDANPSGGVIPHVLLDVWYNSRLTAAQRKFVDHPYTSSVRLVGPAGSGKTLALVVKCLRELHEAARRGEKKRFIFLTHASSTAMAIEQLVLEMDPVDGLVFLADDKPRLTITTLCNLANAQMRYDLDQLTPVSTDGHEGRMFQAEALNIVVEQYRQGDWVTLRQQCSGPFRSYMDAPHDSPHRRFFLWELMNEFACVLDAEGVRSGGERRDRYENESRKAWMMHLETREERKVVLRLYDAFRKFLRELKAIGGDQMIADFLNHLDSYRWEATRGQDGFDAVFVDELHLFNRQERLVFQHLMRDPNARPIAFMAYDAKQSPRDTFLGMPSAEAERYDFWKDAKLGKVEKIELLDVFRYTPQIARALAFIDQSFPGQDLDGDWPPYRGISKIADGPVPIVCELASTLATYALVFKRARALQLELEKGKRVAVLCASSDLFAQYLSFAELRDFFYPITSRDEALGMHHSIKRFVFSMPEYVAGLQYDTVLLIDVNSGEVPEGPYAAAAQRKFVSQVYLGASRAERRLELFASTERGGVASAPTTTRTGSPRQGSRKPAP